ncbi:hypothetical protein RDI58_015293 [Solanum bulbocastanum]|uniref:Cytochrome P450 n=1 Tax=Solanum bulbocastanum TaxID=147425 RepID=A0AAN8TE27_SOLBU
MRRGVSKSDDIIGLLLKGGLSTTEIIEECKEFYLAGQDTTTAFLSWALVALRVQVAVPTYIAHRDPRVWGDDALMFNPNRFSEGVSKAAKESLYFPFGWGARMCIGNNFGMAEAKLILSQIALGKDDVNNMHKKRMNQSF